MKKFEQLSNSSLNQLKWFKLQLDAKTYSYTKNNNEKLKKHMTAL